MSYQPHQSEDLTLKPVAGSVPAQGEAMRAVPAEQLQRWAELCEKGHGHAMAQEIRRALVAASPCAAQGEHSATLADLDAVIARWQSLHDTADDFSDDPDMDRSEFAITLRHLRDYRALLSAAAAQGGQQPDLPDDGFIWMTHPDWFDGKPMPVWTYIERGIVEGPIRYYVPFNDGALALEWNDRSADWRVVAAPAPAAPLTARMPEEDKFTEIARDIGDEDKHCFIFNRDGNFSIHSFAREAIREFCDLNGITLAGTAGTKKESE